MSQHQEILLLGDRPEFGSVVSKLLKEPFPSAHISFATYDVGKGMMTSRRLAGTNLFILDLWRQYTCGLRAEGIATAKILQRRQVAHLIISPLAFSKLSPLPNYWDLASALSLPEKVQNLLMTKQAIAHNSFKLLEQHFHAYLNVPTGHDNTV